MNRHNLPSRLFDQDELDVVSDGLDALSAEPESQQIILDNIKRLAQLGDLVRAQPSLNDSCQLGSSTRTRDTLVEHLTNDRPTSALDFPLKIRLARDFVYAKTHMLRGLGIGLESPNVQVPDSLKERVQYEIGQSIYTLLAEELLTQLMTDNKASLAARLRGCVMLVQFWENSISLEIDDFCPVLESAWAARNKLVLDYGTLMGSVEIMRLMASATDPEFMELFLGEYSTDEQQAFEEFLFGLSHEQINKLRKEMTLRELVAVDGQWVAKTLKMDTDELFSGVLKADAMFHSFRQRKLVASYRVLKKSRGPKHTAEFFLMARILERD